MCRKAISHSNDCASMGNEPCNMWMRKWRHYVELFIVMSSFKKPLNIYCGMYWDYCGICTQKKGELW